VVLACAGALGAFVPCGNRTVSGKGAL
jgi:hypothetical protein